MTERRPTGRLSNRFLPPEALLNRRAARAWGATELFAEGQWQVIRAQLEREGWSLSQIELAHDQLRQGWPLSLAKQNVMRLSGHCPLRAESQG